MNKGHPVGVRRTERQTDHMQGHDLFVKIHLFHPFQTLPYSSLCHSSSSSSLFFAMATILFFFLLYFCHIFPVSPMLLWFLSTHYPPPNITTPAHTYTDIHQTLRLSLLTLINGDLQRWQHHYSCSAATPPRTEKKTERKREDEGQDGREMVSEGGGEERLQLEVFATNVNISREHDVELFITDVKSRITVNCSIWVVESNQLQTSNK